MWYSPEDDVKMCVVKGKDEVSTSDLFCLFCDNYIEIFLEFICYNICEHSYNVKGRNI